MHDEIFHFIKKKLKYFNTPFEINYVMKLLIFNIKWLKTFKNMIKVYQVSKTYVMLFVHNNKYLPLTGLLNLHRTMVNLQLNNHSISKLG